MTSTGRTYLASCLLAVLAPALRAQDSEQIKRAREITDEAQASLAAPASCAKKLNREQCANFRLVESVLAQLLRVAGLVGGSSAGQVSLQVDKKGGVRFIPVNFPKRTGPGYLVIDAEFLARDAHDEDMVAETLAHELGHALQYRDLGLDAMASYGDGVENKRIESHADLIGSQLETMAGYPFASILKARQTYGCGDGDLVNGRVADGDHATPKDRWINTLLAAPALADVKTLASLDPGPPFPMSASPAIFDERGRLRTDADSPRTSAGDAVFLRAVAASWRAAKASANDPPINDDKLRDLAASACGTPGLRDLSMAIAEAKAHPKHLVRVPTRPFVP